MKKEIVTVELEKYLELKLFKKEIESGKKLVTRSKYSRDYNGGFIASYWCDYNYFHTDNEIVSELVKENEELANIIEKLESDKNNIQNTSFNINETSLLDFIKLKYFNKKKNK